MRQIILGILVTTDVRMRDLAPVHGPHRMGQRVDKVKGDLLLNSRVASLKEVDVLDADFVLEVWSEDGHADRSGPGLGDVQEPVHPVNGRLGCQANLRKRRATGRTLSP